jgi:hypothetical protein
MKGAIAKPFTRPIVLLALIFAPGLFACATPAVNPSGAGSQARVVVEVASVSIMERSIANYPSSTLPGFAGVPHFERHTEWEEPARALIAKAVADHLASTGVTPIQQQDLSAPDRECVEHELSGTVKCMLTNVRTSYDINYVLTISVADSYNTAGATAADILGDIMSMGVAPLFTGRLIYAKQEATASLINLNTHAQIWSKKLTHFSGDVRTPEGARSAVSDILKGLPL